jgi:hypothetical protein
MIAHPEMAAKAPMLDYVLSKKPPTIVTDGDAQSSRPQSPAATPPVDAPRANQAVAKEPLDNRPTASLSGFSQPIATQESVQPSTYYAPAAPRIGGSERLLDFETTQSALGPPLGVSQNGAAQAGSSAP